MKFKIKLRYRIIKYDRKKFKEVSSGLKYLLVYDPSIGRYKVKGIANLYWTEQELDRTFEAGIWTLLN